MYLSFYKINSVPGMGIFENILKFVRNSSRFLVCLIMVILLFCGMSVSAQITQRGTGTTATTNTTSLSINKPTGVIQGDVMIAVIFQYRSGGTASITPPTGWTSIVGGQIGNATRIGHTYYKVATGSEPASYTFTMASGGTNASAGAIAAFYNVNTSSVLNATGTFTLNTANTNSVGASAITTTAANTAVLMMGMAGGTNSNRTWSGWTTTSPGALTELADASRNYASAGIAFANKTSTGTTGAGSATLSGSVARGAGVLVALNYAPIQYRSKISGNWNEPTNWERSTDNGVTWYESFNYPTSTENALVTIQTGHTITLTQVETVGSLIINGTLDANTYTLTGTTDFTVNSTGTVIIGGASNLPSGFVAYVLNSGSTVNYDGNMDQTVGVTTYSNLILSGSGTKTYTVTAATVANNVVVNSGVTLALNGTNTLTPVSATVDGAVTVSNTAGFVKGSGALLFNAGSSYNHSRNGGDIPTATWDVSSTVNVTGVTTTLPTIATFNQTFGNVIWNSPSQSAGLSLAGNLTTVGGNFTVISTGTGNLKLLNSSNSLLGLTVSGNFTQSGGSLYVYGDNTVNVGGGLLMTVNGNVSISSGTLTLNANTDATSSGTINVKGNLSISGGTITETGNGTANINFTGTTVQAYSKTAGTISNTVNFGINTGAIVNFGTSLLDGSNGTFNLLSGGTLMTANTGGIASTGATGSIRTTGTRSFNAAANYVYNGTVSQVTGTGLPTALTGNLTISNTGPVGNNTVTLSAATSVSGVVTFTSGLLLTTTNLLSVTNPSVSAILGGSSSSYVNGPLLRRLPASLSSGTIYTYPIGNGTQYLPFSLVNPITTTGTPTVQVRAYVTSAGGTPSSSMDSLSVTGYWMLTPTANVTSTSVSMSRPSPISPLNLIAGRSSTLTGTYDSYGGTVGANGVTNSTTVAIASTDNRYFVFGKGKNGITASVTTRTGFSYKENLGPSTMIQSFTVSGYGLTNNLKVESLRGKFEVSTTDGSSFSGVGALNLPVINGVASPTTIYIRMKAGLSANALHTDTITVSSVGYASKIIFCSGTVTEPAVLTASPLSLTMNTFTFGGGPSTAQSFTISGTLLNGAVTITPPASFEIATSSTGTYQSTPMTYNTGATLGSTTLWARTKAGVGVGTHIEDIVVASSGAVSKNITCTGIVNPGPSITNSTSFLGAFSYAFGSGPSSAQSFVITGQNLTSNVLVTPSASNFLICATPNGTYTNGTLTFSASGSFSQTIYVKMAGGLSEGAVGPTNITVVSSGAVTKSVGCSGTVVATATAGISTSVSSVSGFGYQFSSGTPIGISGGGPSSAQSFTVSGVGLLNDIRVLAPDSFQVSLSQNGTYMDSLLLTRSGGVVNPTVVYVRLKSGLGVGNYSGDVTLISGSASATVACNSAKVYASPLITASGGGDYCTGSTINLTSTGGDIVNRYWEGPNNYYSISQNPTLSTNATSALNGNYVVNGNVVVGGNLIFNGDFEKGNIGFGSAYGYPATPFNNSSLVPEGLYAITTTGSVVHNNFNSVADHTDSPGTLQMIVNGNTTAGAVVWSQNVAVLENADYEFSYWLQTVVKGVDGAPSKLQLYVNGVSAGPVYTANPNSGNWTQYIYNTNAGSATTLNLELINQTTAAGGNDFSLDDISFKQILIAKDTVSIAVGSAVPVGVSIVASQNPVNEDIPVTYTATPVNGGVSPTYQWYVNNVLVSGVSGPVYTYTPNNNDLVKCVLTSSLNCVTGNPATSNTIAQVVTAVSNPNYWFGGISTNWGVAGNWTDNRIPASGEDVEYATVANYGSVAVKDLYVDSVRTIGNLINATSRRLVVPAGKSLTVNNSIFTNNNDSIIFVESTSALPTGTLIFNNPQNQPVHATVQMYSPATWDLTRPVNQKYNWQFFGIPLRTLVAVRSLAGAYVRRYIETGTTISNHWIQLDDESVMSPFYTYELCQKNTKIYTFQGQLVNSNFNSGQLAKTVGAIYPGQHLLANPYLAGIDIRQIEFGSDMEASVYMYHTGTFGSWSSAAGGKVGESAGQYVSVPQNQAGYSTVPRQVPAMGSMLVRIKTTVPSSTANCYVNLNYNALVMKNADLLRAPGKNKTKVDTAAVSTRIDVTGNNTQDKMWIFTKESCGRTFDNGDDGVKILGAALQPQIYAIEPDGNYQINSVDDMNNTNIAFQAGEDTEYTLTFTHEHADTKYEKIYLHDLVENTVTDITMSGSEYKFTAVSTPQAVNRFRIITKSTNNASEEQSNIRVFVYNQNIYVQNFSETSGSIYLYDVTGKLHSVKSVGASAVIAFPAMKYNAYIVKAVFDQQTVTEKIVIK